MSGGMEIPSATTSHPMRWLSRGLYAALLLCACPVWAEDPQVYPQGKVQEFLGLDDTSVATQVQDGRAQDLQNVRLSISKDLRKRYGYSLVGNTLDVASEDNCVVTGTYYTQFSSGTSRIIATCGKRFYYLNGSTWTVVSSVDITEGQNNQFVWTTALDNIIGTNDVDVPIQWNGSTTVNRVAFTGLTDSFQLAKTVAYFKNYLIFGNTKEAGTEYPTRIRWSNVGTINTWTDADFIDVSAGAGEELNAMAELYDGLYLFFTSSIYKVSLVGGDSTFQISKISDSIGSIAKNSVQPLSLLNAQTGLVFLDRNKEIYYFNGIAPQAISTFIGTAMAALNGGRLQYAVSADTGENYVLCLSNGSSNTNNLCLVLNYDIGEWSKWTVVNANAMASVLDSSSDKQVYFGNYDAFIYQLENTSNDNDVADATGTVTSTGFAATPTSSSVQVLYVSGASFTTDELIGAPLEIKSGTGDGAVNVVVDNTTTGIFVADTFSTTPDTTSYFEIGSIDSFYTTKWYDGGFPAQLKHFGEVYFWADSDTDSEISISYAVDFNSDISTQSISLSSATSDATWGSAVWGTSLWGSASGSIFRNVKLETQGRYMRVKWAEDDPDDNFHIYGWNIIAFPGDVL